MAITVPHQSQVGIAVASGGRAGNYVSSSAFVTPGQSAMPGAMSRLAGGIDKLGGAVNDMLLDRQRMQNATDLLADKIEYENALRSFESDYRQTHQGVDARTAAEDYESFHQERLAGLQKKWGGNPYLMESVARMAEGVRAPSMNRAFAFRDSQEEAHRAAVEKSEWQNTLSKLADPTLSEGARQAILKESESSLRMLAGQRWETDDEGRGRWVGGRNVDAELERRRQVYHLEQVETLIGLGKTGAAAKYVREHGGDFGELSNDLLAKIRAAEESNAARGRAGAERANHARLDGIYTQWREEARKMGLNLEETQNFMTGRISDQLQDPQDRKYVMGLNVDDLRVETMRRDAGDHVLGRQYRKYARENNLLPSQAMAGALSVQGLSDKGRADLLKSLAAEAQKATPENTAALNELRRRIDRNEVVEQAQIDAFAFKHSLTDKQAQEAASYMQAGGNTGKITVSRVEGIFKRMDQGKKMPADLYQMVLDNIEPGKPATDERIRQTIANLYMSGETDGSGWFSDSETYAGALREGRGDSWLPGVSKEEHDAISALLRGRGVNVTEERIRRYKREQIMGLPAWKAAK